MNVGMGSKAYAARKKSPTASTSAKNVRTRIASGAFASGEVSPARIPCAALGPKEDNNLEDLISSSLGRKAMAADNGAQGGDVAERIDSVSPSPS
jgi:hypothetical protein